MLWKPLVLFLTIFLGLPHPGPITGLTSGGYYFECGLLDASWPTAERVKNEPSDTIPNNGLVTRDGGFSTP
jgi:hypothetical protein